MPLILLGGVSERATAERGLAAGFDFVAMARAILHHPDIINEWSHDTGAVSGCLHCNRCMPTIYTGTRCPLVAPRPGDRRIETPPWASHLNAVRTAQQTPEPQ
jgi:tRNA-dihydrouridine synthase